MFHERWEEMHKESHFGGKYPNELLTFYVARRFGHIPLEERKNVHFLDVGCGLGASTWFLAREGFSVTAIDGSDAALTKLCKRLDSEGLTATIFKADLTLPLPFEDGTFDCVVDINSLCHMEMNEWWNAVLEAIRVIKDDGGIFSMIPTAFPQKYDGLPITIPFRNHVAEAYCRGGIKTVNLGSLQHRCEYTGMLADARWVIECAK